MGDVCVLRATERNRTVALSTRTSFSNFRVHYNIICTTRIGILLLLLLYLYKLYRMYLYRRNAIYYDISTFFSVSKG